MDQDALNFSNRIADFGLFRFGAGKCMILSGCIRSKSCLCPDIGRGIGAAAQLRSESG
jgi:hypothetical protein